MVNLGNVDVYLGDKEETTLKLDDLMPIGMDMSHEFSTQSGVYAYVAMLAARAKVSWLDAKRELGEVYARVDKDVRKDLASLPGRVTEDMVKAEVKTRRAYYDAQMDELDSQEQWLILEALEKAFSMRADMLISLGAHLRSEMSQTDMHINAFKHELRSKKASVEKKRKTVKEPKPDTDTEPVDMDLEEAPF